MALDENGNPIPGSIDALSFAMGGPPPDAWGYTLPPDLLATTLGPRGTGSTIDPVPPPPPLPPPLPPPVDTKGGRKGGSPTREELASQAPATQEEVPLGVLPITGAPGADLPPPPVPAAAQAPAQPPSPSDWSQVGLAAPGLPDVPPEPDMRAPSMPAEYLSPFEKDVSTVTGATPDEIGDLSDEQLGAAIANLPPAEQAVIKQRHDAALANFVAGRQLEESHKYLAAMQVANDRAAQRTAAVDAEAKRLADINPNGWMDSRTGSQKVAAFISLAAGGLAQPFTGRDVGLEMIKDAARENVEAQKANLAKNQARLATERSSIHDELDRSAVMEQATYETAIKGLQAEAQKFDPRGSTAMGIAGTIGQVRALQAASQQQQHTQRLKDESEQAKADLDRANAEKARAEAAKFRSKITAGAGAGGATNPNYSVATGIFSPFDNSPVMGKRLLGKKGGADEKEFERVNAQVGTYAHVQDYWKKLRDIGAKVEYHKSLGESVWSKFKNTDAAEYDAAKHALVVYLTKELGDKLTQGQIDEQSQRIPERASILEARDPGKQIADAQEDADRDFVRDMNEVGIDATSIVKHAQTMRAPAPAPSGEEAVDAAQQALAGAKSSVEKRDGEAALANAKEQLKAEKQAESEGRASLVKLDEFKPHPLLSTDGLPPTFEVEVAARNEAADTYNQRLTKARELQTAVPKVNEKLKGEADKTHREYEKQLEIGARKVTQARSALDHADDDLAHALVQHLGESDYGGLPAAKADAIARKLGFDPSTFGDDMGGQVIRGEFEAKLQKLTPHAKRKLVDEFFGGGK